MTNVRLSPLPSYQSLQHEGLLKRSGNRAFLIPTHYKQHGITERALFHALKHTDALVDKALEEGGFTEYELFVFSSKISTIKPLRSSIEIKEIDFYREEIDYNEPNKLITPIYFQNRLLKITDCSFNVTGDVIITSDPFNAHLENIVVEGYSLGNFVSDIPAICNYPEAFTHGYFFAKNLSFVLSKEKTTVTSSRFIRMNGSSNFTLENINIGKFHGVPTDLISAIAVLLSETCIPVDDVPQTIEFHGLKSQMDNLQNPGNKFVLMSFLSTFTHYRPVLRNLSNFEYSNFNNSIRPPLFAVFASPMDEFHLTNLTIHNSAFVDRLLDVWDLGVLTLTNLSFTKIHKCNRLLKITNCLKTTLDGLIVQDYTTSQVRSNNDVSISVLPSTIVSIERLRLKSCNLFGLPFFELIGRPLKLSISTGLYEDILMDEGIALFKLRDISAFEMSDQRLNSITINPNKEPTNKFLEISQMSLGLEPVTLERITFQNADLALAEVNSVINQGNVYIDEVTISDSTPRSRSIISTKGFEATGDIQLIYSNLKIINVSFPVNGQIIEFNHFLKRPVILKDSIFQNITSGSIEMRAKSSKNSALKTSLRIENCAFSKITNTVKSFFDFSNSAHLEVVSSNFTEITSIIESFGFIYLSDNSFGEFTR